MLQNLEKCAAYILIDMKYLNAKIKECYGFYTGLYPEKKFPKFDIRLLLSCFTQTAHLVETGDSINVVFFYNLGDSKIAYSEGPQDVFEYSNYRNPQKLVSNSGSSINLYSFFADPEGDEFAYDNEFAGYMTEVADKDDAFTVVMCMDNEIHNNMLEEFDSHIEKKFLLFRNYNSDMGLSYYSEKFSYVTVDYAIALCMGLTKGEW